MLQWTQIWLEKWDWRWQTQNQIEKNFLLNFINSTALNQIKRSLSYLLFIPSEGRKGEFKFKIQKSKTVVALFDSGKASCFWIYQISIWILFYTLGVCRCRPGCFFLAKPHYGCHNLDSHIKVKVDPFDGSHPVHKTKPCPPGFEVQLNDGIGVCVVSYFIQISVLLSILEFVFLWFYSQLPGKWNMMVYVGNISSDFALFKRCIFYIT